MNHQPYKKLYTYWFALVIYDRTVEFCDRWITSYKLREQMTGAARSGKQNIVEGSDGLRVSLKTGIKLTGVSKHSLEELIGDYEDFLRQRKLAHWPKADARVSKMRSRNAVAIRNLSNLRNLRDQQHADQQMQTLLDQLPLPESPEPAANFLLTLCHQATFLLERQIQALEEKHTKEGGMTERLYSRRQSWRQSHKNLKTPK